MVGMCKRAEVCDLAATELTRDGFGAAEARAVAAGAVQLVVHCSPASTMIQHIGRVGVRSEPTCAQGLTFVYYDVGGT